MLGDAVRCRVAGTAVVFPTSLLAAGCQRDGEADHHQEQARRHRKPEGVSPRCRAGSGLPWGVPGKLPPFSTFGPLPPHVPYRLLRPLLPPALIHACCPGTGTLVRSSAGPSLSGSQPCHGAQSIPALGWDSPRPCAWLSSCSHPPGSACHR